MAKVMNVVFGIGVAVVIYLVVILGISAFYNEPECSCDYPSSFYEPVLCSPNMTSEQCSQLQNQQQAERTAKEEEYSQCWEGCNEERELWSRNVFLIANTIGIIAIIASMFLFGMINIAAGTAFAGLALIIYGFIVGWRGTNEILRFFVGLLVAIIVILFAVFINKRYSAEKK